MQALVPIGLRFKIKRKNMSCSNLKTSAIECLESGNYHVYRKLFHAKQHFLKLIPAPENCKNQETNRIKLKKINETVKLCTLATNNLISS